MTGGPPTAQATPAATMAASRRWSADGRLALRLLALVGVALAETCTQVAADRTAPLLTAAVVLATVGAVAAPERHLGVPAIGLIVVEWGVRVDHDTSPLVLGVAAGVLVLHVCLAAFGVAPPGAVWPPTARRRWVTRCVAVAVAAVPAWAAAALLGGSEHGSSGLLVTLALLTLAGWARWVRSGPAPRAAEPGTTA